MYKTLLEIVKEKGVCTACRQKSWPKGKWFRPMFIGIKDDHYYGVTDTFESADFSYKKRVWVTYRDEIKI